MQIEPLILVGGLSSRMGVGKHTLEFGQGRDRQNILQRLIACCRRFQSSDGVQISSKVTISVRSHAQRSEVERTLSTDSSPNRQNLRFVIDKYADAGPASGLIAASDLDPSIHWFVIGCDYPLLEPAALQQLLTKHRDGKSLITCFQNEEGFFEPLLALWSPSALSHLRDAVEFAQASGRKIGPASIIRRLQADTAKVVAIEPANRLWLSNINTIQDWHAVLPLLTHS